MLRNMEFVLCYYCGGYYRSQDHEACTSSQNVYMAWTYIIALLPYWLRFWQVSILSVCLLNFALLLWSFWFYCHKARASKQTHERRQKLDAQYVEIKRTVSAYFIFLVFQLQACSL
jgi:hypothetical protein